MKKPRFIKIEIYEIDPFCSYLFHLRSHNIYSYVLPLINSESKTKKMCDLIIYTIKLNHFQAYKYRKI